MQSFFAAMPPWDREDGSLHVYALPDEEVAERLTSLQARLAGIEGLPTVPEAWLHSTVQRLAEFDDLTMKELTRLADALTAELATVPAFDLEFGAPEVRGTAVECTAAPSAQWDALVAAVRRAASSTFGTAQPDAPHAPHISLAYATGPVSDAEVVARLADAPAVGTVRIDTAHLLSVTVRPELGWFDFIELANWSL